MLSHIILFVMLLVNIFQPKLSYLLLTKIRFHNQFRNKHFSSKKQTNFDDDDHSILYTTLSFYKFAKPKLKNVDYIVEIAKSKLQNLDIKGLKNILMIDVYHCY